MVLAEDSTVGDDPMEDFGYGLDLRSKQEFCIFSSVSDEE